MVIMRKLFIMAILIHLFNIFAFADDNDIYNIINKCIGESIELKNVYELRVWSSSSDNDLKSISIYIYFNTGIYKFRSNFYKIIEDIILIELMNIFKDIDISISTYFPFNIILINNINYDFEERQNIKQNIYKYTSGIIIEHIFQNSMYGFCEDKYFGNSLGNVERVNKLLKNNFNEFLEIIKINFGIGNIISFN
jgi:hypothetical protein